MPEPKFYQETYEQASKDASLITRQLSFAALALVWIFRTGQGETAQLPRELLLPGGIAVFVLFADFLQYAVKAVGWRYLYVKKKGGKTTEAKIKATQKCVNTAVNAFWYVKVPAILVTYFLLMLYSYNSLFG